MTRVLAIIGVAINLLTMGYGFVAASRDDFVLTVYLTGLSLNAMLYLIVLLMAKEKGAP